MCKYIIFTYSNIKMNILAIVDKNVRDYDIMVNSFTGFLF
jgi:hypothetical protein